MYALMILLSLLLTAAFLHAFAYRNRRYLPVFAVVLAAMLYTHNWGLFVTAGALTALGLLAVMSDDRRSLIKDAALGFGGAGLLPALGARCCTRSSTPVHPGSTSRDSALRCRSPSRSWAAGWSPCRWYWRGSGLAAVLQDKATDREKRDLRRRHPVRGNAGGRVAVLAVLTRLDHALPRRRARPDPAAGGAGWRARATSGSWRS